MASDSEGESFRDELDETPEESSAAVLDRRASLRGRSRSQSPVEEPSEGKLRQGARSAKSQRRATEKTLARRRSTEEQDSVDSEAEKHHGNLSPLRKSLSSRSAASPSSQEESKLNADKRRRVRSTAQERKMKEMEEYTEGSSEEESKRARTKKENRGRKYVGEEKDQEETKHGQMKPSEDLPPQLKKSTQRKVATAKLWQRHSARESGSDAEGSSPSSIIKSTMKLQQKDGVEVDTAVHPRRMSVSERRERRQQRAREREEAQRERRRRSSAVLELAKKQRETTSSIDPKQEDACANNSTPGRNSDAQRSNNESTSEESDEEIETPAEKLTLEGRPLCWRPQEAQIDRFITVTAPGQKKNEEGSEGLARLGNWNTWWTPLLRKRNPSEEEEDEEAERQRLLEEGLYVERRKAHQPEKQKIGPSHLANPALQARAEREGKKQLALQLVEKHKQEVKELANSLWEDLDLLRLGTVEDKQRCPHRLHSSALPILPLASIDPMLPAHVEGTSGRNFENKENNNKGRNMTIGSSLSDTGGKSERSRAKVEVDGAGEEEEDGRCLLNVSVGDVVFFDHPLFNEENRISSKIRTLFGEYRRIIQIGKSEYLSQRLLKALSLLATSTEGEDVQRSRMDTEKAREEGDDQSADDNHEETVRGAESCQNDKPGATQESQVRGRAVGSERQDKDERQDCRKTAYISKSRVRSMMEDVSSLLSEETLLLSLMKEMYQQWKKLQKLRTKQGFCSTPVVLQVRRAEDVGARKICSYLPLLLYYYDQTHSNHEKAKYLTEREKFQKIIAEFHRHFNMAVPKLSDDELATLREKCKVIAEENKGVNHEKKKKKLLAEQRGDTSLRAGEGEQFIFRVMLDHSIVNISSGEFSARNDNEAAQEELSRQRLVERSKVYVKLWVNGRKVARSPSVPVSPSLFVARLRYSFQLLLLSRPSSMSLTIHCIEGRKASPLVALLSPLLDAFSSGNNSEGGRDKYKVSSVFLPVPGAFAPEDVAMAAVAPINGVFQFAAATEMQRDSLRRTQGCVSAEMSWVPPPYRTSRQTNYDLDHSSIDQSLASAAASSCSSLVSDSEALLPPPPPPNSSTLATGQPSTFRSAALEQQSRRLPPRRDRVHNLRQERLGDWGATPVWAKEGDFLSLFKDDPQRDPTDPTIRRALKTESLLRSSTLTSGDSLESHSVFRTHSIHPRLILSSADEEKYLFPRRLRLLQLRDHHPFSFSSSLSPLPLLESQVRRSPELLQILREKETTRQQNDWLLQSLSNHQQIQEDGGEASSKSGKQTENDGGTIIENDVASDAVSQDVDKHVYQYKRKVETFLLRVQKESQKLRQNSRHRSEEAIRASILQEPKLPQLSFNMGFVYELFAPRRRLRPRRRRHRERGRDMVNHVDLVIHVELAKNVPDRAQDADQVGGGAKRGPHRPSASYVDSPSENDEEEDDRHDGDFSGNTSSFKFGKSKRRGRSKSKSAASIQEEGGALQSEAEEEEEENDIEEDSEGEASDEAESDSDKNTVHPIIGVSFQNVHKRTTIAKGSRPVWMETLVFPLSMKMREISLAHLSDISENVEVTLFDYIPLSRYEKKLQEERKEDGRQIEEVEAHYRYLGTISIPFSTIFTQREIAGCFRLQSPLFLSGYRRGCLRLENQGSAVSKYRSNKKAKAEAEAATYVQLKIVLNPPLDTSEDEPATVVGKEDHTLFQYADKWVSSIRKAGTHMKKVPIELFVPHIDGSSVFICRYLCPENPPEKIDTIDKAKFFVRLIPFLSDFDATKGQKDVWTSSADFLALNAGDWEEHSILLCNYLTFLDQQEAMNEVEKQKKASKGNKSKRNKKHMTALSKQAGVKTPDGNDENAISSFEEDRDSQALDMAEARAANYIVLGSEVPEGSTVYVLRAEGDELLLFNSIFGQSYNVEDHFCPLQTVDLVANGRQIWANLQVKRHPSQIIWDLDDPKCWKPFFTNNFPVSSVKNIRKIQDVRLTYEDANPKLGTQLEVEIQETLKIRVRRWRSARSSTSFNSDLSFRLRSVLERLEQNALGVTPICETEYKETIERFCGSRRLVGFPLHMTFTDVESIVREIEKTWTSSVEEKGTELPLYIFIKLDNVHRAVGFKRVLEEPVTCTNVLPPSPRG